MIEESVFTNESIVNVIKKKYNINIINIEKLNRGSANLYSLNNKTYILKEYQSKYTFQEITREIYVTEYLGKNNIPVTEYIMTIDNKFCFVYKGKVVTLQKYIDGYTIESNMGDYNQVMESAQYLGKIISVLQFLDIELPTENVANWVSSTTINKSITKHKELLKMIDKTKEVKIYNDLKDKINMLDYILSNIELKNIAKITTMNTHGDYSVLQFIYKNEKINAIIDFASASKMPVVWEIIRSYSYIDSKAKNGIIDIDNLVDYTKEVSRFIKLNKYDLEYMPYLYLVQLLCSTYGYKQYILDNNKKELLEFAIFRTKMCRFLFQYSKNISDKLKEKIEYS